MTDEPVAVVEDGLGDLGLVAAQLIASLRWQLGRFRLRTLNPQGLQARHGVYAGRTRVFTLLAGMRQSDPVVIEQALRVGIATSGSTGTSTGSTGTGTGTTTGTGDGEGGEGSGTQETFESAVIAAFDRWRALDLPGFWSAVADYTAATEANLSEQVLLLTYFEAILPVDPAADPATDLSQLTDSQARVDDAHPVPDVTDLAAAVGSLIACGRPSEIYTSCSTMTVAGARTSTSFAVQAALLALAMFAPDLTGSAPA